MASTPVNNDLIYVDFPTNFTVHPIKKDLVLLTNEDAVKRAIRNIVQTNYYERNDVTLGANLDAQLFELATPQTQVVIESALKTAIENHEPRAKLLAIHVNVDPDSHTASATIVFTVLNSQPITLVVPLLERIR